MEQQFVTVIIWLYYLSPTVYSCSHDQDPCGDFQSLYKMALRGHVFKTLKVPNSLYCLKECKKEARCQSLNHLMGKDTCELNDRTKEATPEDFITNITKLYLKKPKNRVPLGSIPELPAVSCKEIKMSEGQAVSGKYWLSSIKLNMAALAHCDMKTEDVDECTASIPVCEENADGCKNTLGSYICICKPGFTDKDRTCEDIDECKTDSHNCSSYAVCNNIKGSYNCSCNPGYSGNGRNCTDIDECNADTHNCSSDTVCSNTKGSYNCTCKPGHTGNGHNCTDINECAAETHNCSADATCNNIKGSFGCICKPHYAGDGHNCTELSWNSSILSINSSYPNLLYNFLEPVVGKDLQWFLCYRASLHGWEARSFHSRCDGKNNTVTIIRKDEYVFGGYTDTPWSSSGGYAYSSKAFIFSLRDNEGLAPFKSLPKDSSNAIYKHLRYGPRFEELDIRIADHANTNNKSLSYFGSSYYLPSGVKDRCTILAGTREFSPDEVEVFYLDPTL